MAGYLAYILPVGGGPYPDQGLPGPQPRPPQQPGVPTHPIYNPPYPDQGLPGFQPYPDQGLPGQQPRPDQGLPPFPSQGLPGQQPRPDQGLPPFPSHPITLPPDLPEELPDPDNRPIDWKTAWTPATGWIIVGIPTGPVPTPSESE